MPRNQVNSSIKTIWENNPDTPITSATLSKALDLIASYKNYNQEYSPGLHGEYSLLEVDPNNSSQLLFKRGSILQVINEAVNNAEEPIIPKNEQYKMFDVGLDDIILTRADTDETLTPKATWGNGTNQWFVFLCDKDDSTIYNKNTPDEYGGGAQIVISAQNNHPKEYSVPGRTTGPSEMYTEKDTRLIGGFTTVSDTITEVWDIAGKYYEVKSKKGYYILDEYAGADQYLYRQIDVRDLNTQRENVFEGSVTAEGLSNFQSGLNVDGSIDYDTDSLKIDTTSGGKFYMEDDGTSVVTTMDTELVHNGNSTINGNMDIIGEIQQTGAYILHGNLEKHGDTIMTGTISLTGSIIQNGTVTLGDSNATINSAGTWTHNGPVSFDGDFDITGDTTFDGTQDFTTSNFRIKNQSSSHMFEIKNFGANYKTLNTGDFEVQGDVLLQSGSTQFSFDPVGNGNIYVNIPQTAEYKHTGGAFIVDNADFTVQLNNSEPVFNVDVSQKLTTFTGSMNTIIPPGFIFSIEDESLDNIFTIESDPANKATLNGDIEVNGKIFGNLQNNAPTATKFLDQLTLTFSGDIQAGVVTFSGDEGNIPVPITIDRDLFYDADDLDGGQLNSLYYTKTEINNLIGDDGSGNLTPQWSNLAGRPTIELQGDVTGTINLDNDNDFFVNVSLATDFTDQYYSQDYIDQNFYTTNDLESDPVPDYVNINFDTLFNIPFSTDAGLSDLIAPADHEHGVNIVSSYLNDTENNQNIIYHDNFLSRFSYDESFIIDFNTYTSKFIVRDIGTGGDAFDDETPTDNQGQYIILYTYNSSTSTDEYYRIWFSGTNFTSADGPPALRTDHATIMSGNTITQDFEIDVEGLDIDQVFNAITTEIENIGGGGKFIVLRDEAVNGFIVYTTYNPTYLENSRYDEEFPLITPELAERGAFGNYQNAYRTITHSLNTDRVNPGNYSSITLSGTDYILTNKHLGSHIQLNTDKQKLMLSSRAATFDNSLLPSGSGEYVEHLQGKIDQYYDRDIDTSLSEKDKVFIHWDNIYVSSGDFVSVDVATTNGNVSGTTVHDTSLPDYLDNTYYTQTYIDNNYSTTFELQNNGDLDGRYYTETELQTSGGASVHWDNITNVSHSLDDSYNNGSSVTVDSGDVEWLLDDSNRKFSVQTNITTPHVSFDVVNRSTTGSIYTSTGGFIDAYASERFQAISSSVELADGTSASNIDASILIQNGEIKFGDSRGAGFNDYTLTDGSNTSLTGSATSIIGGINEAYNNVPAHNHDADYQAKENGFVYARAYTDIYPTAGSEQNGDIHIDTTTTTASIYINGTWVTITYNP